MSDFPKLPPGAPLSPTEYAIVKHFGMHRRFARRGAVVGVSAGMSFRVRGMLGVVILVAILGLMGLLAVIWP